MGDEPTISDVMHEFIAGEVGQDYGDLMLCAHVLDEATIPFPTFGIDP